MYETGHVLQLLCSSYSLTHIICPIFFISLSISSHTRCHRLKRFFVNIMHTKIDQNQLFYIFKFTYAHTSVLTNCVACCPWLITYIQLPCVFNAAWGFTNCVLTWHNCSRPKAICRFVLLWVVVLVVIVVTFWFVSADRGDLKLLLGLLTLR